MNTQKQKKKRSFPTAYTVLFIVLIFAAILTYTVPAGSYAKLLFDDSTEMFVVTLPDGESTQEYPGTQATLDELGVKVDISKFTDGSIYKAVAIPGTYEKLPSNPQGIFEILKAPIEGLYDTVDIIMFVFIIGGIIGVLNSSGAFDAGFASLSRMTKGKEYLLIVVVTFLISLGGTTFGLAEETIALYPILVPVFMVAGYDAIVCIAALYMGSSIGTMFSTVNPFSSVIASNAAGISFTNGLMIRGVGLFIATIITIVYIVRYAERIKKDPSKSLIFDQKDDIEKRFLHVDKEVPEFTFRRKLMILLFACTFGVMIWGVSSQDWWFKEMTTLFLASGIVICAISGMGEKKAVGNFVAGSADLVGVALTIGVARAVNIIMDNGLISDSILHGATNIVTGMNGGVFSILMLLIFCVLGFFIPSSSGLAVLSMPIMAPLADTVGLPRDVIVSAYQYGQGLMAFITPTGLILVTLSMVDVTYDKWLKFIMPLMGIIGGFSAVMLLVQAFV
ncbi:YfcC family protein [Marinisporobacter balticus]|uniref:Putative ion transporter superfamily protein YfcC n=1 Tax=Marinisporobacter balticus TaxID=2018667 RepID=A0A4R2KVX9_9FIRM|nr:YfcC family protein [Marinisporobacter balticus]TCO74388.1 putative ion transporter superfamily protein YfcC [Marinisporobacter balticus]